MGVRITGQEGNVACMFDSVTDTAFGPVIYGSNVTEATDIASDFLAWYDAAYEDPRTTWFGADGPNVFMSRYGDWYRAVYFDGDYHPDIADNLAKSAIKQREEEVKR